MDIYRYRRERKPRAPGKAIRLPRIFPIIKQKSTMSCIYGYSLTLIRPFSRLLLLVPVAMCFFFVLWRLCFEFFELLVPYRKRELYLVLQG
jgi:hypothetical protein